MRKQILLPVLILAFVFIPTIIAHSDAEEKKPMFSGTASINLRSSSRKLSVSQVQSMPNMSISENTNNGFYGHSTVNHSYEKKSISGDKVVVDQTTGLMWHQSGSASYMKWSDAKSWIKSMLTFDELKQVPKSHIIEWLRTHKIESTVRKRKELFTEYFGEENAYDMEEIEENLGDIINMINEKKMDAKE